MPSIALATEGNHAKKTGKAQQICFNLHYPQHQPSMSTIYRQYQRFTKTVSQTQWRGSSPYCSFQTANYFISFYSLCPKKVDAVEEATVAWWWSNSSFSRQFQNSSKLSKRPLLRSDKGSVFPPSHKATAGQATVTFPPPHKATAGQAR